METRNANKCNESKERNGSNKSNGSIRNHVCLCVRLHSINVPLLLNFFFIYIINRTAAKYLPPIADYIVVGDVHSPVKGMHCTHPTDKGLAATYHGAIVTDSTLQQSISSRYYHPLFD